MHRDSRISNLVQTPSAANGDRLFRRRDAAAILGVSMRWLENNKDIPVVDLASPSSRKSMPRYRETDLKAFIAGRAAPDAAGRS